jgi:Tfp pilus assembly protein PilE
MTDEKKKRRPAMFIAIGCGVVGILSLCVCAGIGYPAYQDYIAKSKQSEAISNLESLFTGAASYYAMERMADDGSMVTGCTVGPATTPNVPSADKQVVIISDPAFMDLGFAVADPIYYQYEIAAPPSTCGNPPNSPALYTFRAHGDLDGNGVTETLELTAGSNPVGELFRGPAFTLIEEDGTRTTITD